MCERDTIPVLSATVDFQSLLKVRQAPDNNRVASFLFISHVALWFLSALSENISELCVFRELVRWTSKPAIGSVVMPFEFQNLQHILTSAHPQTTKSPITMSNLLKCTLCWDVTFGIVFDGCLSVKTLASGLVHSATVLHRERRCLDECLWLNVYVRFFLFTGLMHYVLY